METVNLSLTAPRIAAYFKGDNSYLPTSELLYVHTHPLVEPNFLAEIESVVSITADDMARRNVTGKPVERFAEMAQRLGKLLPDLTQDNAAEALETLRDIYTLCKKITGIRPPGAR